MLGQPQHVEQDEYAGPPPWLLQVQIDVFEGSGGGGGGRAMLGPAARRPLSGLSYFFHTRVILNGSSLRWADMATTQLHVADENSNNVSL